MLLVPLQKILLLQLPQKVVKLLTLIYFLALECVLLNKCI
ncbi:MAG: hypothetical protein ACI9W0_003680, partial [Gammaproteobacteria bacterium]